MGGGGVETAEKRICDEEEWTNIDDRYRCQPHPGLKDKEERNNNDRTRIDFPLEIN